MPRNRPPDSNGRARLAATRKIDTPVLVVAALTAFFATLFATLLVLRPEAGEPTEPSPTGSNFERPAQRVEMRRAEAPPVDAPPPEPISSADQKTEPPNPTLRTRLEELGIKCAEGANCYPE